MEKEKTINVDQGIKDINGESKIRHSMSMFAVVKNESGEEKEVDLRDIVGSKRKNKEENNK